ncbi:MAG: hypothetical protein RDU01_09675 [Thermodesulfovibrionales bacterium]|nr:hypothetical protein [Thermodesulfovibrionales bacterium]
MHVRKIVTVCMCLSTKCSLPFPPFLDQLKPTGEVQKKPEVSELAFTIRITIVTH